MRHVRHYFEKQPRNFKVVSENAENPTTIRIECTTQMALLLDSVLPPEWTVVPDHTGFLGWNVEEIAKKLESGK